MRKNLFFISVITYLLFLNTACTTNSKDTVLVESAESHEILYVYDDGRMQLNSRFVDAKDVVIYSDGRGGEKAAIKVRVPIHADFYRNSIIVVRVVNRFDDAIGQR